MTRLGPMQRAYARLRLIYMARPRVAACRKGGRYWRPRRRRSTSSTIARIAVDWKMEVDEFDVSQGRGYPNGYVQRRFDFAPPRTNRAAHDLCTKRATGEHLLPLTATSWSWLRVLYVHARLFALGRSGN